MHCRHAIMVAAVAASTCLPAMATIVSGSINMGAAGSMFQKLTTPLNNPFGMPNSVGLDNFNSPNLLGFDESQNIVLAAPLVVDTVAGGTTTLAVGTTVASHYIFFDPLVQSTIDGFVDFDADVVAIITSTGLLTASDFLASTGVNYLSPTLRGLEPGDTATISGTRQIHVHFSALSPGDYVRVLTAFSPTAEVPEPGSLALVAAALLGATVAGQRRHTAS